MSDVARRRVVAVVGTTASGKSALAHEVARERGDVEIVTVDSMTVYRRMDIGTAKPSTQQRRDVAYHLLDLVEPSEEFTVAQFQRAARAATQSIEERGHRVLYVGGTGLYGRAVIDDLEIPGRYPAIRAELERRASDDLASLYDQLRDRDPVAASRMEPTNERRVVRALEVTLGANRPFSSFGPGLEAYGNSSVVQIGLRVPLTEIDERVARRFAHWMDVGLLSEVRALAASGDLSRTARQAVGYKELLAFLRGETTLEEAVALAITATRRLARRQRSWYQRDPRVEWYDNLDEARARLDELLSPTSADVRN